MKIEISESTIQTLTGWMPGQRIPAEGLRAQIQCERIAAANIRGLINAIAGVYNMRPVKAEVVYKPLPIVITLSGPHRCGKTLMGQALRAILQNHGEIVHLFDGNESSPVRWRRGVLPFSNTMPPTPSVIIHTSL